MKILIVIVVVALLLFFSTAVYLLDHLDEKGEISALRLYYRAKNI
ncbi:hypothetical protein [Succinivibrio sp.]|jgi:hypothetical protein|nr:hypothetical protein [Succinivibrio sp.]